MLIMYWKSQIFNLILFIRNYLDYEKKLWYKYMNEEFVTSAENHAINENGFRARFDQLIYLKLKCNKTNCYRTVQKFGVSKPQWKRNTFISY